MYLTISIVQVLALAYFYRRLRSAEVNLQTSKRNPADIAENAVDRHVQEYHK